MPAAIEWTPELENAIAAELRTRTLQSICEEDQALPKEKRRFPSESAIYAHQAESDDFWRICARARKIHQLKRLETVQVRLDSAQASQHDQVSLKLLEMQLGDARWNAERLIAKEYAPNQKVTGSDGEGAVELVIKHIGSDGE